MKKIYKMENLDCANCAAKMEAAIAKIDGVNSCSISFMAQKLTIDLEEDKLQEIINQAQKAVKNIERHCSILI